MTEFAAGSRQPSLTATDQRPLSQLAIVAVQHSGVVFIGGRTSSFGWYGYSPLSSG